MNSIISGLLIIASHSKQHLVEYGVDTIHDVIAIRYKPRVYGGLRRDSEGCEVAKALGTALEEAIQIIRHEILRKTERITMIIIMLDLLSMANSTSEMVHGLFIQ